MNLKMVSFSTINRRRQCYIFSRDLVLNIIIPILPTYVQDLKEFAKCRTQKNYFSNPIIDFLTIKALLDFS